MNFGTPSMSKATWQVAALPTTHGWPEKDGRVKEANDRRLA